MGHRAGGFRVWWRTLTGSEETLDNTHLMCMAGRFSRRLHGYAKAEGIPLARRVSRAIRMLVEFYDPMTQRKIVNSEGRFSENRVGREAIGPENSNEYNSSDFVTRLAFSNRQEAVAGTRSKARENSLAERFHTILGSFTRSHFA
jgi:hypothetical protein